MHIVTRPMTREVAAGGVSVRTRLVCIVAKAAVPSPPITSSMKASPYQGDNAIAMTPARNRKEPRNSARGGEVEQHGDEISAGQSERLEHRAAGERADDAGDAVCHRIEGDRGGDPVGRNDIADHAPAHREFARPDESIDRARDDDVPD